MCVYIRTYIYIHIYGKKTISKYLIIFVWGEGVPIFAQV